MPTMNELMKIDKNKTYHPINILTYILSHFVNI
jgi:hypothetical protein